MRDARQMVFATLAAFGLSLLPAAPGNAQSPIVVELYTSQGCAACPPADDLLARLADRSDVIALALHVDYWDYIGWADSFGSPAFSDRQKRYARQMGRASIYTPQIVVGGRDEVAGSSVMQVMNTIQTHMQQPGSNGIVLRLTGTGGAAHVVEAQAKTPLSNPVTVQLVRYMDHATVEIMAGENSGRSMTYRNIVTRWDEVGTWDGVDPLQMDVQVEGSDNAVVILQEPGPGKVLAAARAQ